MSFTMTDPISWEKLENESQKNQNKLFAQQKDKFERESVSSDLENVNRGDHLVCKGSTNFLFGYEHHFLCTEVKYSDEGVVNIEVLEYTGGGGLSANPTGYSRAVGSSDLTGLGKIKSNTFTYEELERKKVEKEIWPEELERFDVDEVIRRAKSRESEQYFDALNNNCEQFVRWCKCGLNVSLQVKRWYTWARQGLYSLVAGGKDCVTQLVALASSRSVAALASDELVGLLSETYAATAYCQFPIGFLLEIVICSYQIIKAHKKTKELAAKAIEDDELLRDRIVGIVSKGVFRFGLGALGSVVGLLFGGPLGSFIGGAIGGILGHLLGFGIRQCYKKIRERNEYHRI